MTPKKTVLLVFGTRPELIKVAPVLKALKARPSLRALSCATAQHRGLLDQMLAVFKVRPDYDLDLMRPGQTPDEVLERAFAALRPLLKKLSPDMLLVQGDTTTAAAAALLASLHKIPVGHIEAGLRSFDNHNPFPEEINRVLIDRVSDLLFAPTRRAAGNLRQEGLRRGVHVTGNTSVDALLWALERPHAVQEPLLKSLPSKGRIILVTLHRRENFGKPLRAIFKALRAIADAHPDVRLVYPVHPNPNVREEAHRTLGHPRIVLCPPLAYLDFLHLMRRAYFFISDSGGIQEEAPSLRKPILVARETTERPETIEVGAGLLVGTRTERIVRAAGRLLTEKALYARMSRCRNPYGDGRASEKIAEIVEKRLLRGV